MHNILFKLTMPAAVYHKVIMFLETLVDFVFRTCSCHSTLKRCSVEKVGYAINRFPRSEEGCITQNKISLMTIVAYRYSKVTEAFQTTGPIYLRAVWYLPFINSPRNLIVTYNFSDLQEVYSDNHWINTKCQLQFLHPP